MGNSCGKILWEKTLILAIFSMFIAIFKPLTGSKTLQKHFYFVDEVLSFDLVGHM